MLKEQKIWARWCTMTNGELGKSITGLRSRWQGISMVRGNSRQLRAATEEPHGETEAARRLSWKWRTDASHRQEEEGQWCMRVSAWPKAPGMKGHQCRAQTVTTAIVPVARGSCGLDSSSISIFLMIVYKMTPKFISQPWPLFISPDPYI